MMQYLSATQARTVEAGDEEANGEEKAARQPKLKGKPRKGRNNKPDLMSPESAMKAVQAQEAVFGSASQLVQEETELPQPQAEPAWTQQTQTMSIESTTPRTGRGTARFVRTRNLWGVAARDEDNALLHVDRVDMFNTPDMRIAFAGKDALLQPHCTSNGYRSPTKSAFQGVVDVDDFDSPLLSIQSTRQIPAGRRSFHTSTTARTPSRLANNVDQTRPKEEEAEAEDAGHRAAAKKSKSASEKPSYEGLTIHDLQKQISSFGFKPVKKREKMIQLLEQCWEEKHGERSDAQAWRLLE